MRTESADEAKSNVEGFDRYVLQRWSFKSRIHEIHHYYGDSRLRETLLSLSQTKMMRIVLDAGCGRGDLVVKASACSGKVIGTDLSFESLKQAKQQCLNKPNTTFVLSDLGTPCFRESCFDVVLNCEVIEHVSKPRSLINIFHSMIKKDGILAISTPNPLWIFLHVSTIAWALTRIRSVYRKLRREENWWHYDWGYDRWIFHWHLDRMLESAGFRVLEKRFMLFIPDARTLTFTVLYRIMSPQSFLRLLRSLQKLEKMPLVQYAGSRYARAARKA